MNPGLQDLDLGVKACTQLYKWLRLQVVLSINVLCAEILLLTSLPAAKRLLGSSVPPDPRKFQAFLISRFHVFRLIPFPILKTERKTSVLKKKQLRILAFILENVIINGYFRSAFIFGGIFPLFSYSCILKLHPVNLPFLPDSSLLLFQTLRQAFHPPSVCHKIDKLVGGLQLFVCVKGRDPDSFNMAAPIGQSTSLLSVTTDHPPKSLGTSFLETKAQGGQTASFALPSITQPQLK